VLAFFVCFFKIHVTEFCFLRKGLLWSLYKFRHETKQKMRRGVKLRGERLQFLRRARGWSQLDLAERAGVGERTIRNAEIEKTIQGSTASYIAGALEVALELLVKPNPLPDTQFSISRFELAFREALLHGRTSLLTEMLSPNCIWRIIDSHPNNVLISLEGPADIERFFSSLQSTSPWNEQLKWHIEQEESTLLSSSFFIVANYSATDSALRSLKICTHFVGQLNHEKCQAVTQICDKVIMES
jgi:transcriptional regulator with XRE-family HTH domain